MSESTQEMLEACCREWQKRLRLQDWKVEISWCHRWEIEPAQAQVAYCCEKKHARIRIGRPAEYEPSESGLDDVECHIVHELLHLHFWWLDECERGSGDHIVREHAINLVSQALVAAKREVGDGR